MKILGLDSSGIVASVAITVGFGGKGGGEHTIHEWYEQEESYKGPQRDLLLLLALSGYKEEIKYQLSSK